MLEHVVIQLTERLCPHVPGRLDAHWYWNFVDVTPSVKQKPGFTLTCMKCGTKLFVPTDQVVTFVVINQPENTPVCQDEDDETDGRVHVPQERHTIPHAREVTKFDMKFFKQGGIKIEPGPLVGDKEEKPK